MRLHYLVFILVSCLLAVNTSSAATEMEERATVTASTQEAFLQGRFSELNEVSRAYRTDKSRTSSGLWKLTLFYVGISTAMQKELNGKEQEAGFRELEAKTAQWAKAYPTSPAAHITHSMLLISHAWAYRGGGYASTVKPESWAPFRRYIAMARDNLEKHKAVASIDPRWYEAMLTIARAESWGREQFDSLLNEALNREPLFYQTYFLALEYLLPKWHGDRRDIEAFAQNAAKRTFKSEGRGLYARIYWFASQTQYENDLFSDSLAQWSRMKKGFDDVVAKYPDAWNLNNYAKFACLAHDKPTARALLKRIESDVVAAAWPAVAQLEYCKEWSARQ
jgi:hypothetical protein